MARSFIISTALFALQTVAQVSVPYTDPKTGIDFRGYIDARTGYHLGIALPENPTTDFIAQIQAPITNDGGWAGFSMGQSMTGNLLVVAYPNAGEVVSSFRLATGYSNPAVATGDFTMNPIPDGTYVNDTAFSYTFLCKNCISTDPKTGLVIYDAPSTNVVGWAFSSTPLTDSTSASAALNLHTGFGAFGLPMTNATSAKYDTWAAMAVEGSTGSGSAPIGGGNSTAPATPIAGNTTATVANATYDYIVAGAGPAGIIAAQRIAESGASVLLIERGGPSYGFTGYTENMPWNETVSMYDVPGYGYYLKDVGTPAYCDDTADMAGCLLGGGTSVNAMMFVKPRDQDWDDKWPTGWKSSDVSAAADRVWERNPGQTYGSEDGKRYNDEAYDVLSKFFAAQGWADTDFIKDPNSKTDVFGHPPWNVANGLRSGPVRTYLPLAEKLDNFKLMLNTKVIRAVREGSSISGMEVETADGKRVIYNVNAGGSVLLAAGAMSTPRLLFNSGIGPADQLKTVQSGTSGVTLPAEADWIDLPVGAEIKDHPIFTVKFTTSTNMSSTASTVLTEPDQTDMDLFAKGSGILAQSGQRLNWWTSVTTSKGNEVFFQGTCNGPSDNTIQMKIYITHGSQSVGSLGINAAGATEFITNPHMTSEEDTEAVTMMMDRLIKMTSAANSTLSIIAPTGVTNVTAADLIKDYKTGSHYVGTAKVGTKGDAGVVVDTNTKVYGTDNLFVVDASFHADLPTGNTQAIVMVAAEAAAERILALGGSNATAPATPATPASSTVAQATSAVASVEATPAVPVGTGSPAAPSAAPIGTGSPAVPSAAPVESAAPSAPAASAPASPAETAPATPPTASSPAAATVEAYGRCGGIGYDGPTTCVQGFTCTKQNDYYSQCTAGSARRAAFPVVRRDAKNANRAAKRASFLESY
ncbi:choline dehydrogenase [Boeremia exigua]|uniref:choline dehydrogenase n=1 Tax=Boeremia exigua TaxID=749465 RepID=UPI001E8CDB02|nr:choline dehydrogenase [Boeremia exigua]KAH6629088.1 choline dehydrogenase [Boeremia exigua]